MTDKTLSDEVCETRRGNKIVNAYLEKDVKDFIQKLKIALKHGLKYEGNKVIRNQWVIIDKLAGDALIHSPNRLIGKSADPGSIPGEDTPEEMDSNQDSIFTSSGTHSQQDDRICPDCKGLIRIRNPTGKCDHLYYPEYKGSHNPAYTNQCVVKGCNDKDQCASCHKCQKHHDEQVGRGM